MTRPRLAVLVAALALGGCNEEASRFPVVVTALTDDGKPLADLPVTLGKSLAGKTGPDGKLAVRVVGKDGQRVAVSVEPPKGYRLAAPAGPDALVLRRLVDLEGSGTPRPIEHVVKLSPLERKYAVLVRVGVAGLPVETFGARQAVTNERGLATFLYTGAPGDELQVKLDTSGHPELRPQNPTVSFLLAHKPEAYVVKERFTVTERPKPKPHKPVHLGPKPL